MPRSEIVGGFWGGAVRTDPADSDFADVSDLVDRLRRPVDLPELAALATQSAQRCSALRGPKDDPTADLANALGALGYLRAHTGSARGLIFAPGTVPGDAMARLGAAGFRQPVQFLTGGAA